MKINIILAIIFIAMGVREIIDKRTGMWGHSFDLSGGNIYLFSGGILIIFGISFFFTAWKNYKKEKKE